jgi:hypothetical protein
MTSWAKFGRPSRIRVLLPQRKSSCCWSPSNLAATSSLLSVQDGGRKRSARIEPPALGQGTKS